MASDHSRSSGGGAVQAGIQGVVLDPNGSTVPDAKVTLTSQETTIERTVTTTAGGVFTISALAPGKYTLSVEKAGFSKKVLSDVLVTAEQVQSLKIALEVGQVTQSVTVEAGAPLMNTESHDRRQHKHQRDPVAALVFPRSLPVAAAGARDLWRWLSRRRRQRVAIAGHE